MKKYFFLFFSLNTVTNLTAQTAGDYRSIATGNWTSLSTWERFDGATWVAPATAPTSTDGIISIRSPHTVTVNSSITIDQTIIEVGGTLDISGASVNLNNGIGTDLDMAGSFTSNSSTISGSGSWANTGTVNLLTGTLTNGCSFTNSATINFVAGTTFQNNSTFNYNTGSLLSGTGIFNQASTMTLNISLNVPSTIDFNVTGAGTTNGTGDLTINTDFDWFGTISGSGALTINGNIAYTGGIIGRPLTVANSNTFTMSGFNDKVFTANLVMNGTMNWNEGTMWVSAVITNNGNFNITTNVSINNFGGTPSFVNNGTVTKSGAAGNTTISIPWTNAGSVNLTTGTITSSNIFTSTGTINFTAGTTFQNNSTFNYNTGSLLSGTGIFNQASTMTLNISLNVPSTIDFNLTFPAAGTINGAGDLTINTDFDWFGTISGAGALTINGNIAYTGGIIGRLLTVANSNTFTMSGPNDKVFTANLVMNGTMNWNEGTMWVSAVITNNGNFNITTNVFINNFGGTPSIVNTGTITKSSTGTTNVAIPVTNSSTGIIKGTGTYDFSSSFSNNGTLSPGLSPGIVTFNGTQPFSANSTLSIEMLDGSGAGTGHDQLIRNGNLTLDGTLTVTETGTVPNGTYTIINLTSGTVSGSFASINLPTAYMLQVNASDVQLIKNSTLPLTLITFTAQKTTDKKVSLQWVTTNEQNVSHFEVQRSSDGINYTRIAIVQARNSPVGGTYNYRDETPLSKTNYYRLRMVDLDAGFQISPVRKIVIDKENYSLSIYPNPAIDFVQIDFSSGEKKVQIDIFDVNGKLLYTKQMNNDLLLQVPVHSLAAGLYHLRVSDGVITANVKFVKK